MGNVHVEGTISGTSLEEMRLIEHRLKAAGDMYNALWEAVELSDRTMPPSGRNTECQRVYDLCRAALKRAENG